MSGNAIQAIVLGLIPLVVLWRGTRSVGDDELERWAARFGVLPEGTDRTLVVGLLHRGRRLRSVGMAVGLVLATMPAYMNLIDPAQASDYTGVLYGLAWVYGGAFGTLLAEILVVQRPTEPRAVLEWRRWSDFVPRRPVSCMVAATLLGLLGTAVAVVRDTDRSGEAIAAGIACLVAGAGMAVGLRRIVNRPRMAQAGRHREVDDALRAHGAHHLTGAALAMAATSATAALSYGLELGLWMLPLGAGQYLGLWWWWSLARESVWRVTARRPASA